MRLLLLLCATVALSGCSHYVPGMHPLLVISENFRGEVLLCRDKDHGVLWTGEPLVVPPSGVIRVSNLEALARIRPDAYNARYASGRKIGNRNRGGNWNVVGLWPLSVLETEGEPQLVCLVIGTWDEKTEYENYRIMHGWKATLESIRSGKEPIQAPEPTPLAVTPRADARVAPSSVVAHL